MSASLRTGLSKDERSGSWFDELTTSGSTSLAYNRTLRDRGMTGHEGDATTVTSVSTVAAGRFRTQGTLDPFCRIRDK